MDVDIHHLNLLCHFEFATTTVRLISHTTCNSQLTMANSDRFETMITSKLRYISQPESCKVRFSVIFLFFISIRCLLHDQNMSFTVHRIANKMDVDRFSSLNSHQSTRKLVFVGSCAIIYDREASVWLLSSFCCRLVRSKVALLIITTRQRTQDKRFEAREWPILLIWLLFRVNHE